MAAVTFEFRSRGAARVQRDMQRVIDSARAGAAMLGRLNTGLATTAQQAQQAQRNQLLGIGALQRAARGAEREYTGAAREGSRSRVRVAHDEARERSRELMRWAEGVERAERRATAASEREASRRARSSEREAISRRNAFSNRGQQLGDRAASAVMQFGSTAHGMIQDARRQYAASERTALVGLRGGGASGAEALARVRELQQFAATNGMDFSELTRAAAGSQGQFSTLAGDTAEQRSAAFQNFLQSALFARNSGNSVEQTTRLQGFFQQQGFSAGMQRDLLRFAAGAANAGSVELGDMISQALQPITQRIETAQSQLVPGATQEERTRVAAQTFRQTIAELQVQALSGTSARTGGNALSSANAFLASPTRQAKILSNIRNDPGLSRDQRDRLQASLFTRGPDGRQRLSTTNALDFADRFREVVGNNPLAMRNVFAGTGEHGNGQSMLMNQRNALAAIMRLDNTGRSRVRQLMSDDVALSEESLVEGAQLFGNDTTAQLNREDGARMAALTDNTSALNRMSNALAAWASQNPLLAQVAGGAAGGGMSLAAGAMGRVAGQAAATSASFAALQGAVGSAGAALGNLGAVAGAAIAGLAVGQVAGDFLDRTFVRENRTTDGTQIRYGNNDTGASLFDASTWRSLGREIRDAFESNPPVVRISPQAAAQAAGVARTQAAAAGGRT